MLPDELASSTRWMIIRPKVQDREHTLGTSKGSSKAPEL